MRSGGHAPDAEQQTERDSGRERGGGPERTASPPDPPPAPRKESDRAVTARKGSAALSPGQRRGGVVQRSAEFDDVARSRVLPVILEERVPEQSRSDRDAQEQQHGGPAPGAARGGEARHEGCQSHGHQRRGDPRGGAIQERPRQLPRERPVVGSCGPVEAARHVDVERTAGKNRRGQQRDRHQAQGLHQPCVPAPARGLRHARTVPAVQHR
jgi:hypothetical protein